MSLKSVKTFIMLLTLKKQSQKNGINVCKEKIMGKQIGSEEKPITFRSPIYKNTHGSKGANPRPGFYTQDYRDNWDRIFGKKKTEENNNDND